MTTKTTWTDVEENEIIIKARKDFDFVTTAELENRQSALEDLNFLAGDQWPESIKLDRQSGDNKRPCLTINRLRPMIRKVVGDQRQNRVGIKVHPKDDLASKKVAQIFEGIIRDIEYQSNAYRIYNATFQQSVSAGFPGFFRVITQYKEDSFDQEIRIERIRNQFSVFFDPDCDAPDFSDAKFCFVIDYLRPEEFDRQFPDAVRGSWDNKELNPWFDEDKVQIAEYFWIETLTKTLVMLNDASIHEIGNGITQKDLEKNGLKVKQKRQAEYNQVYWCKMTGNQIIEGPQEWPGRYIPIIVVAGDEMNIENKRIYSSLVRDAKDPQRSYNYWRTAEVEKVALAPKAPFLVTPEQIQGHETMWKQANIKNYPYLTYNPTSTGKPQREQPIEIEQGLMHMSMVAGEEIMDTMGLYKEFMGGATSTPVSGRAVSTRLKQSEIATFVFQDNLHAAVALTGRVLIDLIPKIYDSQRTVGVREENGNEKFVNVNKVRVNMQGPPVIENDLSTGKYDVTVEVGPSYSTQRIEAAESMMSFVQYAPQAAMMFADIIAENMDWPGSEKVAARIKKSLPPALTADEPNADGTPKPPPQPGPQEIEQQMKMEKAKTDLEGKKMGNALKMQKLRGGGSTPPAQSGGVLGQQ